jgi:hypothetical protein
MGAALRFVMTKDDQEEDYPTQIVHQRQEIACLCGQVVYN